MATKAQVPTVQTPVTLTGNALPVVTQSHIVSLIGTYVKPYLKEGDTLSTKDAKAAELAILKDGLSNPFLVKVLAAVYADKRYGSLYGARKAATDTRGTFRSDKDKADYRAASLIGIAEGENLNVGEFTYTDTGRMGVKIN
jgi:hypothetical protein